jgi:pimeloyl-ACP methyl ester carboxylesterase
MNQTKKFIAMSTFIKTIIRMFFIILSILTAFILIIVIILLVNSPGKPEPFLDNNGKPVAGSISEKIFITIGGVRQGMFIRGVSTNNPVLLYVHGGPAFPNYFLIDKYKPGLEEIFTVCYWEQRGGGLSYDRDVTPESMNFEQLATDAIEVTNYLRERFGKEKIYILAHSGGTPFAIMAAAREPDLYYAYMGMAQISRQSESEKLAYKYIIDKYIASGNKKAVAELKKYPVLDSVNYIIPFHKSLIRDASMHDLGIGTMRNMKSVIKGVFIPVWMCKAYTLREKLNIWYSKFSFIKETKLIDELFATDLTISVPELEIPVYFFSGRFDLTVNHDLSLTYLNQLHSPLKAFYSFSESAHSPLFEEPQRFKEILVKDVVKMMNEE